MRHWAGIAALLAGLCLGVRLIALSADPPATYPTGEPARELLVEGPAKAAEARRFGLFGRYATDADDYRIWGVHSPAFVAPLARFFAVFSPGYVALRVFCGLAGALGLVGLFALARRHADPRVAPIACLIVCASFHDLQLTRSGLIEPYLNAVLIWTVLLGVLALRRLPWLAACALGFAVALLTKQTALFAAPLLLGLGVAALVAARRRRAPAWQFAVVLAVVLALALGLLTYVRSPEYVRTIEWNFGHMIVGVEEHREIRLSALDPAAILGRLVDPGRWLAGFLAVIPLGALALVQVVRTVVAWVRRRPVDVLDLIASAWLLLAVLALQLSVHVRPRFSIIVLPPAALLAASLLAAARARLGRSHLHLVPLALAAVVVLATDVRWTVAWLRGATHEIAAAGQTLGGVLDERSVVIGGLATPLAFDTTADLHYVKGPFNTTHEALAGLGVTHLLLRPSDPIGKRVAHEFPAAFAGRRRIVVVELRGTPYTLYRLDAPLRRSDPPAPP